MNQVNHLYIHIPFCKHICWYCDFKRSLSDDKTKSQYIDLLIKELNDKYKNHKFKTIYVGGGTPNCLNHDLYRLLNKLSNHLQDDYEFTIECNPEFITDKQIKEFVNCKVNRISLGVQSTNDNILKQIGRKHTIKDVENAINIIKNNITNFSIDLIYGFNEQTIEDIQKDFEFINKYKIPHVSFYSLEIKDNSIYGKMNYHINEVDIEDKLKFIERKFSELGYIRYEVSNWCRDLPLTSKHNLAYWNSADWIGMGYGAFGFQNFDYYNVSGSSLNWNVEHHKLTEEELYQQVFIMGLRTIYGLDLNNELHNKAYQYYKNKLDKKQISIKNNHIVAKNLNTIDNILIDLI